MILERGKVKAWGASKITEECVCVPNLLSKINKS